VAVEHLKGGWCGQGAQVLLLYDYFLALEINA
jgi:hypothetical protein